MMGIDYNELERLLYDYVDPFEVPWALKAIDEAGVVNIVRCKECIHHDIFGKTTKYYGCTYYNMAVDADHFCKYGERRADDDQC